MITTYQANREDQSEIAAAYETADLRCDPNHSPHPPEDLWLTMLDHGCLFLARDDNGICGTALVPGLADPEVKWLTILHGDPAEVWESLGDAIRLVTGKNPHGVVRNAFLRERLLKHERLVEDENEPERLRWQ